MSLESDVIESVMASRKPEYQSDSVTLSTVLDFNNKHDIDSLRNEISRRTSVNHYSPPKDYDGISTVQDLLNFVRSTVN